MVCYKVGNSEWMLEPNTARSVRTWHRVVSGQWSGAGIGMAPSGQSSVVRSWNRHGTEWPVVGSSQLQILLRIGTKALEWSVKRWLRLWPAGDWRASTWLDAHGCGATTWECPWPRRLTSPLGKRGPSHICSVRSSVGAFTAASLKSVQGAANYRQ